VNSELERMGTEAALV